MNVEAAWAALPDDERLYASVHYAETAVHEAGHAVVAVRLGMRFVSAHAVPSSNVHGVLFGQTRMMNLPADPMENAIVIYAGPAAEREFFGRARPVAGTDRTQLRELAGDRGEPWRRRARERARELVRANRAAVERVATALLLHGWLTDGDVLELVNMHHVERARRELLRELGRCLARHAARAAADPT